MKSRSFRRIGRIFPPFAWLGEYEPVWLRHDAIAGVTLAAYAIPVSLAYAGLAGLPPQVGIYGYLGYDMVRLMERLPAKKPDPLALPDAVLMRPTTIIVFDSVKDEITVVTPSPRMVTP